jgi:transcriptional repressor NrdR
MKTETFRESGIPCPECGCTKSMITDARPANGKKRRRRECERGHRFTTHEVCETVPAPAIDFQI